MAEYLLRNSLSPSRVVKCTVTFRQITNKGEEGEPVWLIEIGTADPGITGSGIAPVFVHYTSSINLDDAIREATEEIAQQVDWSPMDQDTRPPLVSYTSPNDGDLDVNIYSNLVIDIKDLLPSAGIDVDSISVTINDFDVTSEIEIDGDPYEYRVTWRPEIRVLDYYQ